MAPAKLNQASGMPQMGLAFSGWQQGITLQKVTQQNVRGDIVDVTTDVSFSGTVQPLDPEQVQLKPEGQRSWEWLQMHCFSRADTDLRTNDRVRFDGKPYKVMAVKDYNLNNYVEYHLVGDYLNGS